MEHGLSTETMAGSEVKRVRRKGKLAESGSDGGKKSQAEVPGFRFPTAKELATMFADSDLQQREPLWVATYLFTRTPHLAETEHRLGTIFPKLTEQRIAELSDSARIWWVTDGRDLLGKPN